MALEILFSGVNLFVLPFWALMILLPNWGITRKVMGSLLPFAVLASCPVMRSPMLPQILQHLHPEEKVNGNGAASAIRLPSVGECPDLEPAWLWLQAIAPPADNQHRGIGHGSPVPPHR